MEAVDSVNRKAPSVRTAREKNEGCESMLSLLSLTGFLPRYSNHAALLRNSRQGYESMRQSLDHVKPYKVTKTKQTRGTTKPVRMERRSAMWPMNGAAIAPPTMDITIRDEPSLVCSPSPRMPSAKMVGNP